MRNKPTIRIAAVRSKSMLVTLFGLMALALSAAIWGITNLGASAPGTAATPSPETIAEIKDILFQDEAVKGILASRNEGRDYWIRIDTIFETPM